MYTEPKDSVDPGGVKGVYTLYRPDTTTGVLTMSARQEKWVIARLHRTLHKQLLELADKWQEMGRQGDSSVPYDPDRERPSLNQVIQELYDRDQAHRERSQKHSRTRRGAGRKPEAREASQRQTGQCPPSGE